MHEKDLQRRPHPKTMKPKTPKERVLVIHPDARCLIDYENIWTVSQYRYNASIWIGGIGKTPQAAWRDAASKLRGKK